MYAPAPFRRCIGAVRPVSHTAGVYARTVPKAKRRLAAALHINATFWSATPRHRFPLVTFLWVLPVTDVFVGSNQHFRTPLPQQWWRTKRKFCRNTQLSFFWDDSPQGIWEVTETGRQWLTDASSQRFFYTLAALRIGNLSGDRPHPVTMGGYRNFVRQYAQQFGEPALGEADDHLLTDQMVLLWNQGCMELKKYDPAKNEWWDFAQFQQDVRRLVGRGDWTIRLTPEGRARLAKLEDQAKLMRKEDS